MEGKRKNADKETKKYKKENIIFSKNVAEKSFWGLTWRKFFPEKFIPTGLLYLVYIIRGPMKQQNAYRPTPGFVCPSTFEGKSVLG